MARDSSIGFGFGRGVGFMPGGATYSSKVLGYSPIAYWLLNETSGTTADNAEGTAARDGTYDGVTLNSSTGPDGQPVGLWDSSNDTCDIYSASLNTAFKKTAGTLAIWIKVSAAGVWTDGSGRYIWATETAGSADRFWIFKDAGDNTIKLQLRQSAGATKNIDVTLSATTWQHLAITWDDTADEFKGYLNGSQTGSTIGSLSGGSAAALTADRCNLGAYDNAPAPNLVWSGYLAHAAVWDVALTPAQMAVIGSA